MRTLYAAALAAAMLVPELALAQSYAPPPGPPPGYAEPPPPAEGYVLIHGHYRWNGAAYVWVPAHWVPRRAGYAHWVPGHWGPNRFGQWVWHEGHWAP